MKKITNYQLLITNHQRAFTLIELLIVIAIIGIISSLLISNYIGVRQRARDTQRKSDLKQIQSALEIYRADNGSYPGTLPTTGSPAYLNCAVGTGITGGTPTVTYMQQIPCDPSSNGVYRYYYSYISSTDTYSLIACLENSNDSNKDTTTHTNCSAGGGAPASITVKNP